MPVGCYSVVFGFSGAAVNFIVWFAINFWVCGPGLTTIMNLSLTLIQGNLWSGVDITKEDVTDNMASFVWEPAVMKINAITAASEAACMILSVDETVKNANSQKVRYHSIVVQPLPETTTSAFFFIGIGRLTLDKWPCKPALLIAWLTWIIPIGCIAFFFF
jgi:hypothetical protein